MADLLQSQIRESCKLAMPEGLKELMSDISREVLRTQPQDIYHFISNYLGALLKAREALSIACFICNETFQCACEPALYDELRDIGLDEDDIGKTVEIIKKQVESGSVKEANLFAKLIRKTSLDELQISAVQSAMQGAYRRHRFSQSNTRDHGNEMGHTLSLYRESTSKTEELFVAPEFKRSTITKESQKVVFNEAKVASINKYQEKIYINNQNELDDNYSVNEEIIEEIEETNDSECSIEECLNISLYDNDD